MERMDDIVHASHNDVLVNHTKTAGLRLQLDHRPNNLEREE
jgi:hypothetical protein